MQTGRITSRPQLSAGLDYALDEKVAKALEIDVLGRYEDGTIEAYSEQLRRTVSFRGLSNLKMPELEAFFGTPVRRIVMQSEEDEGKDLVAITLVREALGHLASRCLLSDETKLRAGVWHLDNPDGSLGGLGLVNGQVGPTRLSTSTTPGTTALALPLEHSRQCRVLPVLSSHRSGGPPPAARRGAER